MPAITSSGPSGTFGTPVFWWSLVNHLGTDLHDLFDQNDHRDHL